eukprot:scaffold41502_cov59-Phaeocystis_antarctica.AAC.1
MRVRTRFEPKFSALGPNFSHARMARGAMPPLCGTLENLIPNAYLHSSFYLRRIADPKNRSRLTRHDFAYVIFPRVPQRAPLSDRLVSTPHFRASPPIYHPCQCRASAAAPGFGMGAKRCSPLEGAVAGADEAIGKADQRQ